MRKGVTVTYVYGDHLGSASVTANISGTKVSEVRYYPFGETRYASGTTPTSKRFNAKELQTDIGLYDYGARFYDPTIGRFISADSVVPRPGNPQNLNRYSYSLSNPVKYLDPTGHDNEISDFLQGALHQWNASNRQALSLIMPISEDQARAYEALAINSDAFELGRVAGAAAAAAQGVVEFTQGGGIAAGGAIVCTTVALCLAGAPAIAVGTVEMAHGAIVALQGGNDLGTRLGLLFAKSRSSSTDSLQAIRDRFGRITTDQLDPATLDAARREMKGEVVAINPKDNQPFEHIPKVEQARNGLRTLLDSVNGRLNASGNFALAGSERESWAQLREQIQHWLDLTQDIH